MTELERDDCWFFIFQSSFALKGEIWEKSMPKKNVFPLMQPAQSFEENFKFIFVKKYNNSCCHKEKSIFILFF